MIQIDKRIAENILHALEGGMVPENGLPYIAVGRKEEIVAITQDMDQIARGHSTFRILEGAYGTGKSFMAQLTKNEAILRGFVVMECELAPERKLCGTKKEGLETYRTLMAKMSVKDCPCGGALEQILDTYFEDNKTAQIPKIILSMPHGFDYYTMLEAYKNAYLNQEEMKKYMCLRWFRGEFQNKSEAKKMAGATAVIEDNNWFSYIKLWAIFLKEAGYTGMYLILDELTQITRNISNSTAREHNFERLLSIYNDCYGNDARYIGVILCGIPVFHS